MKKKKRIILFCLIGVLVAVLSISAITFGTVLSHNSLNGTLIDDKEIVEGTDTYDWRKNTASISYGYTKDSPCSEKFYSNGKHTFGTCDDYITDIYFEKSGSDINLCFDCEMDLSCDIKAFFVFDNGYTSSIVYIPALSSALGGTAVIKANDISRLKAQGKEITNAHITEVWVQTISGIHEEVERMMVHGQYVYTGTGENDWRKSCVDISISEHLEKNNMYTGEIYSNGHNLFGLFKDYVKDIFFREGLSYLSICYTQSCSWVGSMDVFFVFDTGYATEISTAYGALCVFGGHIKIPIEEANKLIEADSHVVAVWVRTNE